MDQLKICSVEFDDRDPFLSDLQRPPVPRYDGLRAPDAAAAAHLGFSPTEARGSAVVAIRNATITMIEDHRDLLKQIVAEAETLGQAQWNTSSAR